MAIKKTIEIDVNEQQAVRGLENLNKEIKDTGDTINKTKDDMSGISGVADNVTGGAISKFNGLKGTIGNVSKGFTTLKGAIISTGIGALVLVIGSLISAFSSSEEGQNKFAKLMGVIGSVVGNVMDVISDLGEVIIGVLSGDSEAIKSATAFGKKIFDVVGLPMKNLITTAKTLGKTLGALFSGDISGAFDELKNGVSEIGNNFKDTAKAINSGANALSNFGKEALREAQIAQQIADQRAKADKTDRDLIVKRAEADRKVAELREKALDREKYNTKQRIAFLNEASKVEQDVTNKEIQSAKLRRDAIIEENKLSKSNKDALKAEEEAKASVINLETKRLNIQKALTSQISSLKVQERAENQASFNERKKQIEDEQKLKEEQIKKDIENEQKRQEAIDNIRKTYKQKLEDLEDTTELEKAIRQEERALLELENLSATEEQKIELQQYYTDLKNEARKKDGEKIIADNKAVEDKITADKEVAEKARQNINNIAIQSAQGLVGILAGLGEKNKGIQKASLLANSALSIAEIINNTNVGSSKEIATKGVLGLGTSALLYAKMAISIGSVISATAKGLKNLGGGSVSAGSTQGGGGGGGGTSPTPATAPTFNVVGNTGVNQIEQSLGSQQPVQAYVVANNVTTAQSLDRNIINNASLG